MESDGERRGMLGEIYVVCELRSALWKGGWRRIVRFINR